MGFLSSIGKGLVGAATGGLIAGAFSGGALAPLGALAGFVGGVASDAFGISGFKTIGMIGGAVAGTFLCPIPILGTLLGGMAGGMLGGLFDNMFNQAPQPPPYAPYLPGSMPTPMPMPYPMPMPNTGFPQTGYPFPNAGGFGFNNYAGCYPPMQRQCCCCPPQYQQPCQGGGTLQQGAPGQPITYTTSGGYKVCINGDTVNITDPSGRHTVSEWGDPHENVDGRGVGDWSGKTRTIMLQDGTRITMNANGPKGTVQGTSIYDGAQEVQINNNNNQIMGVGFNPWQTQADASRQYQGDTAYFGVDQTGAEVFRNFYRQNPDGTITPNLRDLAVLQQPYRQHGFWAFAQAV